MTARHRHSQRPDTDPLVALYDIDITRYGGQVQHWTPGPLNSQTGNLVPNPCCQRNTASWIFTGNAPPTNTGRAETLGAQWAFPLGAGYMRRSSGIAAGQWMDAATRIDLSSGWPANQVVEAQARLLPIRCRAFLSMAFLDANGTNLKNVYSDTGFGRYVENGGVPTKGDQVDDYGLVWLQTTIPAGTTRITLYVRGAAIGGVGGGGTATDPYVFFSMVQLAFINQASNLPLPFMPPEIAGQVSFGGVTYTPVPIQIERVQWTGQGPIPRPQVSLPNIGGFAESYLHSYGDLLGCRVTRRRVYRRFLDGQVEADPTDYFGPDIWYIDRVALRTPEVVVLELASPFDIQGKMLPGRQVIRDVCTRTYRTWIPGQGFILGNCPYNGPNFWKADGTPTGDPAEDDCGRRTHSDCTLRFPDQPLPTWAFPGVVRSRI